MRPPCRRPDGSDCPRRAPGCQARCQEYAAYAAEYARRRAERLRAWELKGYILDAVEKRKKRKK